MLYPTYKIVKLLSWLWLIIVLLLAVYSSYTLLTQNKIQFDLLALLPQDKTASAQAASQFMQDVNLSGRIVILLGSSDAATAKSALQQLRQQLRTEHLPIQEQSTTILAQDYKKLFTELYPYRAGLITDVDQQHLKNGQANLLVARALGQVMSPFSSFRSEQISSDPFLLYPQFVLSLQPATSLQRDIQEDMFVLDRGVYWYLFQANITEPVFSLKLQQTLTTKINAILSNTHVPVLKTGALFYAAAGARQAKNEISIIGTCSIIGIILILLVVFQTTRPILLALCVVASGLVSGLAMCLYFLDSIHILALVFGCSLVGVAVDYALHYFCASYKQKNGVTINRFAVLKTLMPALPLGVLSSVLGYGLLMVAPFPGIQQMAVLAGVGLVCTFISVCLWGPYFLKQTPGKTPGVSLGLQNALEKIAILGQRKYCRLSLTIMLLVIFSAGMLSFTVADNVRGFQSLDADLKTQEDQIKSLIRIDNSMQFLTITANNLENVLQTEQRLTTQLDHLHMSYKALSQLIPSQQRQQENRQLLEQQLYQKYLTDFMRTLGLNTRFDLDAFGFNQPLFTLTADTGNAVGAVREPPVISINQLPIGWRELVHYAETGTITGRIMLNGKIDAAQITAMIKHEPGVSFIDPVKQYSSLFASYRKIMTALVFIVLLSITVLLAIRKGVKAAATIVMPVLLSILASIGMISLLGAFTLFHAMGLMMALCIGIDYALFLYWRDVTAGKNLLLLGNGLSAITTILSFGLLALSRTNAVHDFGLAVFLGIALCFLVTTLFLGKRNLKT